MSMLLKSLIVNKGTLVKKNLLIVTLLTLFQVPLFAQKAAPFQLPELYNLTHTVGSDHYKGKVILLNLWASWCSGCQAEMPRFVTLQKHFSKKQFEIVTVNIDNEAANAKHFLAQSDPQKVLTALYDGKKSLPKAYACIGMPTSYLIDKDGDIIESFVGSLSEVKMTLLQRKIVKILEK